jgi:hypothetical protein
VSADLSAESFFELLKLVLLPRRGAFRTRCTVAFAVVDGGAFVLDTHAPELIEKGYRSGCDVSILCNTLTLHDMACGRFDPDAPEPHHFFRWGGDGEAMKRIARVLSGGRSLLATRVEHATFDPG